MMAEGVNITSILPFSIWNFMYHFGSQPSSPSVPSCLLDFSLLPCLPCSCDDARSFILAVTFPRIQLPAPCVQIYWKT